MSTAIAWRSFIPLKGGSFGRRDMGTFCEVGNSIFVVPQIERSRNRLTKKEIELNILNTVSKEKARNQYELVDGKFVASNSINWREKIHNSAVVTEEWLM